MFGHKGLLVAAADASQAFPIYYDLIKATVSFESDDKENCVAHLQDANVRIRHLLRLFYDNLTEARVSHSVWLSYVQGFQGWGVGRTIDGRYVKFDGLSGNHVLFFQALDAFLGLERYLTDENMRRYVPARQRALCLALKKHSFRHRLRKPVDRDIDAEIQRMVNHLKVRPPAVSTDLSLSPESTLTGDA